MKTKGAWAGVGTMFLVVLGGCALDADGGPGEPELVGTARQRLLGVPEDGYPSYAELELLVALNRARSDPNNPAAGTAASECSEFRDPQPPLLYDHDLGQAARFHCNHLAVNGGGLSHKTFCDLQSDIETGCPGAEASCSCVPGTECWSCQTLGGCGTGPGGRATLFGFQGSFGSETGAAGYGSGWAAVGGWVTENCNSGTLGHRHSVTSPGVNVVGAGLNTLGMNCWGDFEFADYGKMSGLAIGRIASGFRRGNTYYANYYDAAGAPQQVNVVVDGVCQPMQVEIGSGGNLTMIATGAASDSACHKYYFLAFDAGGERAVYPEQGSYQFGGCPGDGYYSTEQAPADCDQQVCAPVETCGNGLDDDCNGTADDGCGGQGGNGSGGDGSGATAAGGDAAPAAEAAGDEAGGCGCRMAPWGGRGGGALALLLAALLGARRRRVALARSHARCHPAGRERAGGTRPADPGGDRGRAQSFGTSCGWNRPSACWRSSRRASSQPAFESGKASNAGT